jgi:actin-related protein
MHGGDEVGGIVMDIGTHTTKAGFSGEDTPKAIFPSVSRINVIFLHFSTLVFVP